MNYKGGKKEGKCVKCGTSFFSYPSIAVKRSYCSKKCSFSDETRNRKIVEKRKSTGSYYKDEEMKKAAVKFDSYKASSKRKKRVFEFDKDTFIKKVTEKCFYCGDSPSYGLDRKDPFIGYTEENVVPCCMRCNFAKHTMMVDEFKDHIIKVYNNFCK
jgi:hypothetical protein